MDVFKIGEKYYPVPTEWHDISLHQSAKIMEIQVPNYYKREHKIILSSVLKKEKANRFENLRNSMTLTERYKKLPKFYLKILHIFSGAPGQELLKLDCETVIQLYLNFCKVFVQKLHVLPNDAEFQAISKFPCCGIWLNVPDKISISERESILYALQGRDYKKIPVALREIFNYDLKDIDITEALQGFKHLPMDYTWRLIYTIIQPLLSKNNQLRFSRN